MKNLWTLCRFEWKYIHFRKLAFILGIAFISIMSIQSYLEIQHYHLLKQNYNTSLKEVLRDGGDFKSELEKPSEVSKNVQEDGTVVLHIDNILRYDFDIFKAHAEKVYPQNLFSTVLQGSTLILLPLCVFLFGLHISTYDFANKTIQSKCLIGKTCNIFWAKIIVSWLVFTAVFLLTVIGTVILSQSIGIQDSSVFAHLKLIPWQHLITQTLTTYLILTIYLGLGICGGFLINHFSIVSIGFLVYHLVIPNLHTFDFKNAIVSLFRVSYHQELITFEKFKPISPLQSVLYFMIVFTFLISISLCKFKKQSK